MAVAALLVLGWLPLYHGVYPALYRATFESPAALSALQLGLAALALGPPCIGMGATLPLMSRAVVASEAHLGRRLGFVYALNTFGGVARRDPVGLLAARRARRARQHVPRRAPQRASPRAPRSLAARGLEPRGAGSRRAGRRARLAARRLLPLALVATASGLGTLALEVLFTRLLVNAMDASVFSFALVLATFLVSLALGSALVSAVVDRLPLAVARSSRRARRSAPPRSCSRRRSARGSGGLSLEPPLAARAARRRGRAAARSRSW